MSDRSKFSPQFKVDAIALVFSSGRLVAQVASEIGVVEGTLENRVQTWKEAHVEVGNGEPGPVELVRYQAMQLELELAELKQEPEFLTKVSIFLPRTGGDRRVRVHSLREGWLSGAEDVSQICGCSRVVLPVVAHGGLTPDVATSPTAQRACATRLRPRTCGRVRKRVNVPQKFDERNPHVTSCKDTRRGRLLTRWDGLKRDKPEFLASRLPTPTCAL